MYSDISNEDSGNRTSPGVDTLLGTTLGGRFRVVEPIGQGGMGRVYRAVQTPLNRPVALKVLDRTRGMGTDRQFQQRFLVEAALTAKLSHPNTVTVLDFGATEDGLLYIAMEYLEGQTLDDVLTSEGPLDWFRALNIGQQVARSVREAHQLGVVHRDLKPGNVMMLAADDSDTVKVLDFGLVKSFVTGQELEGRAVTQQGMVMGSPPYMAPEQGEHNRADPRSDVYSLGAVLYEVLTGQPPFIGKNPLEVILKHVHQPVPPLQTPPGRAEIPKAMQELVLKCLAKSPMDRYQSMEEVLHAMQALGAPGAVTPATGIVALTPKRSKALPALLFLLAVLVGTAGASVVIRSLREARASQALVRVQPEAIFHVESTPSGASVQHGGKVLGLTPLDVALPVNKAGVAKGELTLSLAGHATVVLKAQGQSGSKETLKQLMEPVKPPLPEEPPPVLPLPVGSVTSTTASMASDEPKVSTPKPPRHVTKKRATRSHPSKGGKGK